MGIKNLNKLLKKYVPSIFEPIDMSIMAFKKIAIDASIYMYKYKAFYKDIWIHGLLLLVLCLRKNILD